MKTLPAPTNTDLTIDEHKSHFLHALRWLSALLVVIGHSQLIGGGGDGLFVFISSHAHAAVMVFFVISGYVIAADVDRKKVQSYTLRLYLINRISRIYSVLLPAILLTLILDFQGAELFHARYADPNLIPQNFYFVRLAVNLLSLQGIWGFRVQLGSNPALWSIGYEVSYYLLFGIITWRPKFWKLAVPGIILLVGPVIVAYGLIWLLGVFAYRSKFVSPFFLSLLLVLLANHFLEYDPIDFLPEVVRDLLFAVPVALLASARPKFPSFLKSVNLYMASFSFSLYAFHMPIMFFVYSVLPATPYTSWAVVIVAVAAARGLYHISERHRGTLRKGLLLVTSRIQQLPV